MAIKLRFLRGTVELHGWSNESASLLPELCQWDPRTQCYRAPAVAYAQIVLELTRHKLDHQDEARCYRVLDASLQVKRKPRPYQMEALESWQRSGGRGLVVLPTGAGKSYMALLAIEAVRRETLIVAPTLDLVSQWYELLRTSFRSEVGVIGGGEYNIQPLTVGTYDSAYIHMENIGARYGLVVFDECHHLPGQAYSLAAQSCLAPYRLGLTATPDRTDGRHELLTGLIGPTVYKRDIGELSGDYLADYTVEQILVDLTDEERQQYDAARGLYRGFVSSQGIRMSNLDGWSEFVLRSSLSAEGRRAMKAYQRQRRLAFAAPSKLKYVDHLLHKHRCDRVLLFTESNKTAYDMSRRFLIPVITHQTKVTERSEILDGFASGSYNALATSKVLNEGVDMPDANVGIVISGSGSVREHVQRLGRILRKRKDKKAVLYELVSSDTSEMFTSNRRRHHVAFH